MSLQTLILVACTFAAAIPIRAQAQPSQEINALLEGASHSLDRYKELASDVRCDEATRQSLRESCKRDMEMLSERVQETKEKLARYRQSPAPAVVDFFDIYEMFHRIMEGTEVAQLPSEFYGEHNQRAFARIYNNFVKITAWVGGVARDEIQNAKCP
ncbi:MAG TPA: hypothetical protein VEF05_10515 [Terriglobales bacterium]|nr:hypothetical protein [Terriglobales bacterium]